MARHFSGIKPQGVQLKTGEDVCINFEEYEAINLCDYELPTQAEAAKLMNVSMPIFTRIYESVHRKITKALIEGSSIYFEGGNVAIASWYRWTQCKTNFTLPENAEKLCPFCKTLVLIGNNLIA